MGCCCSNTGSMWLTRIKSGKVHCLKDAPDHLKSDRDFALAAVAIDARALSYLSAPLAEELMSDEAFMDDVKAGWIKTIRKKGGQVLVNAPEALKEDRKFIAEAADEDIAVLAYASTTLLEDRSFMQERVKLDGLALAHASEEIRNHETVVKAAVKQNGIALKFASEELQNTEAVARVAVRQNPEALEWISAALRSKLSAKPTSKTAGRSSSPAKKLK